MNVRSGHLAGCYVMVTGFQQVSIIFYHFMEAFRNFTFLACDRMKVAGHHIGCGKSLRA